MLDSAIAALDKLKEKPLDPKYKPQHAIRGRKLVNQGSERLIVLFPGWQFRGFFYNYLIRRLAKKGWAVLAYDFHDQVLESDDQMVLESFHFIQKRIAWEIKMLDGKHDYKQVHFVGISLGNVPLTMVADAYPNFTDATIVLGGDDLAKDMWHGLRTLYLRDEFKDEHINLSMLDTDWWGIAPMNHVKQFARKKTYFFMSMHDKFILTKYQKSLAKAISDVGGDLVVKKSRLGHAASIIRFCVTGSLA